jgi:hypothetical protein
MASTLEDPIGQPSKDVIDGVAALMLARERFPNLCANGILGRKFTGPPVDPGHVTTALAFLSQCRKTKIPTVHSFDLRREIGDVSLGAVIAAATALNFDVRSWYGPTAFPPHALIGVSQRDVRRVAAASRKV